MSKIHITMKDVRKSFRKVYFASYCDLQNIFYTESPKFYNAGVYGWNCDIYVNFERDIAITTGYRNMTGTSIPFDLIKKYDGIAKEILTNYKHPEQNGFMPWDEKKEKLEENLKNFWNELNS